MKVIIDNKKLKSVLDKSFNNAILLSKTFPLASDNQFKSSLFVSEFGKGIFQTFYDNDDFNLKTIKVNNNGKKISGEWLLDICVTNENNGFIENISLAAESESNVSLKAFQDDFAKVFHIKADNYIYLNGLNQLTTKGLKNYIIKRVAYTEKLLNNSTIEKFYLGFWTSPQKKGGYNSLWIALNEGLYPHLQKPQLFEYSGGRFLKVS